MSIQSVMGRIDQILTMQQQLLDPQATSAASSSATSGAYTVPGTTSAGGSSTSFSDALASAQTQAGLPVATAPDTGSGLAGSLTASSQVQAMTNMANSLVGKPYVWGGGHAGWGPQAGYDCSGFVSAVLHAGGYLSQPADTTSLPSQAGIESGPGQYVTIYDRAQPGENGHVIIDIGGQFYESGGSAGAWGGGGGVEKIGTPSASYLATFPNVLHPSGL
jgi:cell wall-associated NlpC family hydrolase